MVTTSVLYLHLNNFYRLMSRTNDFANVFDNKMLVSTATNVSKLFESEGNH